MKAVVWSKPACPHCESAKQLLRIKGIEYEEKNIFLANPIGVAEHIDYVVTAEKKLEALASAEDKLGSLKAL